MALENAKTQAGKTYLEELVEMLHNVHQKIREIAVENLVGYSKSQPTIFKTPKLEPIRDLKILVKDPGPCAADALTILINLSGDKDVLQNLAEDDMFIELLLQRIVNTKEKNSNLAAMLLANLAKDERLKRILLLSREAPKEVTASKSPMDQLMDCFVKGAEGNLNKHADFNYLAYFFADIAQHSEGRKYLTTQQAYDQVIPISKLVVFTEHKSDIRRRGVSAAIKNVCFEIDKHSLLLSESEVNLLPYILLPIVGPEEYPEDEMLSFPPDLQLLSPTKARDADAAIIHTHLQSLLLLTTTRPGRDYMRRMGVYPLVRETDLHVDSEAVHEACDQLVQVLMRDEEDEGLAEGSTGGSGVVEEEEVDDDMIMEVV
ncbi:MAG: hypothetical protein M1829_002972 [Trizodia sp. TS-e1964]|nr:MAG: hypothetical protein M1829_002972 [Trizodia sp. TS-e1964]